MSTGRKCALGNVLFVPDLAFSLLSLRKATESGAEAFFSMNECHIVDNENNSLGKAVVVNGLYQLECTPVKEFAAITKSESFVQWHERLGHTSNSTLDYMLKNNMVTGMQLLEKVPKDYVCVDY